MWKSWPSRRGGMRPGFAPENIAAINISCHVLLKCWPDKGGSLHRDGPPLPRRYGPPDRTERAPSPAPTRGRASSVVILHRVGYPLRGEAGHVEVERVCLLLDRYYAAEYTEGADHPLQPPYRVEVEWYPYVHGGRWGWSAHLGLSDQHPSGAPLP